MTLATALVYHTVSWPPEGVDAVERSLFLSAERFSDQLDDLKRRGFHSVTLNEYAEGLDRGSQPKTVLITFDDAYDHVGDVATPILRHHGFTAVMFAPLANLGGSNTWDAGSSRWLASLSIASAARLRSLDPQIWDVASHGHRHTDLRSLPSDERRIILITARERLAEIVGRPVLDLAYPYGANDASLRRDVQRAGYRLAFAAANGVAIDRFQLPRWPISGEDSLEMFRLKTSAWSLALYRAYESTPLWFRRPATALVRKGMIRAQ